MTIIRAAKPPFNRELNLKYSSNKNIAKLVRSMIQKGWRYDMGRRHGKLTSPVGKKVIVPCTPSDYRAYQNFKRDLRKYVDL